MDVYSQLVAAQIENRTTDPSPLSSALAWFRTDTKQLKIYDGTVTRVISFGASGGGGGSLSWVPDEESLAAVDVIEYAQKVWKFGQGLSQKIFTVIKVPASYSAGDPITLKANIYSPDASGTILLQSVSTLIRVGTDAFSSTTNQRTSTNSANTLSGSADIPRAVSLDLTSTTGTINSVAVSAGDLIKVQLVRGTDTATEDFRFVESSAEVTFS